MLGHAAQDVGILFAVVENPLFDSTEAGLGLITLYHVYAEISDGSHRAVNLCHN